MKLIYAISAVALLTVVGFAWNKGGTPSCPSGTVLMENARSYTCYSKGTDGTQYETHFFDEKKVQKSCKLEWHNSKLNGLQQCWYMNGKPFASIQAKDNRAQNLTMWKTDGSEWLVVKRNSDKDLSFEIVKYNEPDRILREVGAQGLILKYLTDAEDKSKEKINYFNLLVDAEGFSKAP